MKKAMMDISAFHYKFELKYEGPPRSLPIDLHSFRYEFMMEELREYMEAWQAGDVEKQFDALIDLCYVALGTAYLMGGSINISKNKDDPYQPLFGTMWNIVHEANMAKVRTKRPEDSKRASGYDVVKPEGWTPPDFSKIMTTAYYRGYANETQK